MVITDNIRSSKQARKNHAALNEFISHAETIRTSIKNANNLDDLLVPQVLRAINFDIKNTVFSYIPNTAETAFYGLMAGIEDYLINKQKDIIIDQKPSVDSLEDILSFRPRIEKLVLKDVKLRTFITDDEHRDEMVAHVYDTTYEVIRKGHGYIRCHR